MSRIILAIESSCDETAAAIFREDRLLSERVASQQVHEAYGGVVPELASRAHQQHIVPVVAQVCKEAGIKRTQLTHIAFTQGPGLIGSLLVGTCFAKGLGMALNVPLVPVHHIKAHLLANFIEGPRPQFPFLGLVVSGGHTQLLWVESYHRMELLGQTLDDAIGEAFDKIAKMLGFSYPGGKHIDAHAGKGDPKAFSFPITRMSGLNFSFSGIKTAVLYFLRKASKEQADFAKVRLDDICASVQYALVTMIEEKVSQAMAQTGARQLVIGGGVAANSELKRRLRAHAEQQGWKVFIPSVAHCQDNAAMIGMAGYYHLAQGGAAIPSTEAVSMARMPL